MTDLATQVQRKLSAQLESRVRDLEAETDCTLFVPQESDIVTEIQNASRFYSEKVRNHPAKERGRPHIWFLNTIFS